MSGPTRPDPEMEKRLTRLENEVELEINDSFLVFMATCMNGYRKYLTPIVRAGEFFYLFIETFIGSFFY